MASICSVFRAFQRGVQWLMKQCMDLQMELQGLLLHSLLPITLSTTTVKTPNSLGM